MISQTDAADENAVAPSSVPVVLNSIKVEQRTQDAPVLYLQLFNNAAPTVGTTKPNHVVEVPAGRSGEQFTYLKEAFVGNFGGKYFDTALAYAVTTTPDGNTAPDAGDEPRVVVDYEAVSTT